MLNEKIFFDSSKIVSYKISFWINKFRNRNEFRVKTEKVSRPMKHFYYDIDD